ncbi:MAG: ABC transporter ATP-binding protein [Planctomycetota bacterium]
MKPLIEVRSVSHSYDGEKTYALSDVSMSVYAREHLSIVGKSGSGKTTLLNLLGGLDRPTRGTIFFDGEDLGADVNLDLHRAKQIGFVFQRYYLLPNLTAAENVQIPMFETTSSATGRKARSLALLESVGLGHRVDHRPSELSGGEAQRVAIARAVANEPRLILADEPTGALDTESGETVLDLLEQMKSESGLTLIVVTHNEEVAARGQRAIRLSDGRVEPFSSE